MSSPPTGWPTSSAKVERAAGAGLGAGEDEHVGADRGLDPLGGRGVERQRQHHHAAQLQRLVDHRRGRAHHQLLADPHDGDAALVLAAGLDGCAGRVHRQAAEAVERVSRHPLAEELAARVGHLHQRRRQLPARSLQRFLELPGGLLHRQAQVGIARQLHRVGADLQHGVHEQVEADVQLAVGLLVQPLVERPEHDADRHPGRDQERQERRDDQRDAQLVAQAQRGQAQAARLRPRHHRRRNGRALLADAVVSDQGASPA